MSPIQMHYHATSVPEHSPVGNTAKAICELRGVPPYSAVHGPAGVLMAWQAVIVEGLLMQSIFRSGGV